MLLMLATSVGMPLSTLVLPTNQAPPALQLPLASPTLLQLLSPVPWVAALHRQPAPDLPEEDIVAAVLHYLPTWRVW